GTVGDPPVIVTVIVSVVRSAPTSWTVEAMKHHPFPGSRIGPASTVHVFPFVSVTVTDGVAVARPANKRTSSAPGVQFVAGLNVTEVVCALVPETRWAT